MKMAWFVLLDVLYVHQSESKDVLEYQYAFYQLIIFYSSTKIIQIYMQSSSDVTNVENCLVLSEISNSGIK